MGERTKLIICIITIVISMVLIAINFYVLGKINGWAEYENDMKIALKQVKIKE